MQSIVCKVPYQVASPNGDGVTGYVCPNDTYGYLFPSSAYDATESGIPVITVAEAKTIATAIGVLFALAFIWRKLRDVV